MPVQLLTLRLRHAWGVRTGSLIRRPSFRGLWRADVGRTLKSWEKLTQEHQGLLRTCRSGNFYTRDKHYKAKFVPTEQRQGCQEKETAYHRNWECPHFAPAREAMHAEVRHILPSLPPCTSHHGWILEVPALPAYRKALTQLPDTTGSHEDYSERDAGCMHLFVDGSCDYPTQPDLRIATWAVVRADLAGDNFPLISRGVVPGILQTSGRAELLATIAALRYGLWQQAPFCIWTGYETPCQRMRGCMEQRLECREDWTNHDLWQRIWQYTRQAMRLGLLWQVTKALSHLSQPQLTFEVERWAARGNQAADVHATVAREDLPGGLRRIRQDLVAQTRWTDRLRDQIHGTLIRVGQQALRDTNSCWSTTNTKLDQWGPGS